MDDIMISQNDYGFVITTTLTDTKNTPVNLLNEEVKVIVITPSGKQIEDEADILDGENGLVSFVASKEHTAESGNHSIYYRVFSPGAQTTVLQTEAKYYFVLEELGGA